MRRTLLAVTASGLLLLSTACSSDDPPPPVSAPPASTISTPTSAAPTSTDAATCKKLFAMYDEVTAKFGNELASILAAKSQNDQAGMATARGYAQNRLGELGFKLRDITQKSDRTLKAAAEEAAKRAERAQKDTAFFNRLESAEVSSSGALAQAIVEWKQPVVAACP